MSSDWDERKADLEDRWTCVKSSVSRRSILESELVLTSMGIDTRIEKRFWEWRLMTPVAFATHARIQLDLYYKENRTQDRPRAIYPTLGSGIKGVIAYLMVIWFAFFMDMAGLLGGRHAGALSIDAVNNGAWWLTLTALTLHADLTHILANSLSGSVFGFVAARYLGDGFAWFLILLSGALGNFLNAWLRDDLFYSIGASTACFAAAGIVCGFTWRKSYVKGAGVRLNYLPIAGAIFLFVFMGMEGENTDVLGHLCGLVVGLCVGIFVGRLDLRRLGRTGQHLSIIATACLLLVAWFFVL